jgi:transposase
LNKLGLPVICIDARHAKAAFKMQINKSDRNDAVGIARIMQCGWYKEVRVKDLDSHAVRALLVSRALLVKIKRDLENQVRGLLKNLGLVIGPAKMNVFALRAAELTANQPELAVAVTPLLTARVAIEQQVADLDRKVMKLARNGAQARQFMTAPGIGPITALCFLATTNDPRRFKRSRSVGAYAGLTTRRYASGEIDWTGSNLEVRRQNVAQLSLRSSQCAAHTRSKMVSTQSVWHSACETKRATQSQGRGCPKACCHSASDVDRWYRIKWSSKDTAKQTALQTIELPPTIGGNHVPAGTLALVSSLLALRCSKKQARFTH